MSHQKYWDQIVAEVQRRHDSGESFTEISRLLGGKHSTRAYKIYHGDVNGKNINIDKIKRYMSGLGLKVDDAPLPAPGVPDNFGLVRRVKATLGAGESLITDDEPDGEYAFRLDFLRQFGPKSKLVLFPVMGDSMEPTLRSKDLVLIDEADKSIRDGDLYGIGIGDTLQIKRVFVKPDSTIVLKSDNEDYPTWDVPKHERPRIIGKAKWLCRML
jgi:phage repressor protein C with HTH and peptisase S24 domain